MAATARLSILPAYNLMTWHKGSPQTTVRSSSSLAVCATTPSSNLSCTVVAALFFLRRAPTDFTSPDDRSTTMRPALLSVQGGTFHTGRRRLPLFLESGSPVEEGEEENVSDRDREPPFGRRSFVVEDEQDEEPALPAPRLDGDGGGGAAYSSSRLRT
ncbi:hypothetical protein VTK73DRAFT_9598 [Phialemonium thermophilum]|uniref:Uncharacterized protein n=1 Tax=Phialemonium thermophilum TaxID=223376 RepID=A0ABR3W1F0_9PEZI